MFMVMKQYAGNGEMNIAVDYICPYTSTTFEQ